MLLSVGFPGDGLAESRPTEADLARRLAGYEGCFVTLDLRAGTSIRVNARRCAVRLSPCSTFKIPNSLIALETGVVPHGREILRWDRKDRGMADWNRDHCLESAFRASAVWYYQELARRIGASRMRRFLALFRYGNQDLSGGLDRFWLQSSLAISPDEQVAFLARLARGELPLSSRTVEVFRRVSIVSHHGASVLRGKTGSALDPATSKRCQNWFVGWLEGPHGTHVFAAHIAGPSIPDYRTARRIAEQILHDLGLW
ncbi:MAG: class D beta-lactamase [Candidatus Riflebacteria bacterium]|nr:class D beta-lactamase [Candidatus Riflebacteria bacterium]